MSSKNTKVYVDILSCLLYGHVPVFLKVDFVANDGQDDFVAKNASQFFYPILNLLKECFRELALGSVKCEIKLAALP